MEILRVPRNPVVVEVAAQNLTDRASLFIHGLVHNLAQPLLQRGFCPAEALALRLKHRLANGRIQAATR